MSHRLVQSHHVQHRVHGETQWGRFNAALAVYITRGVGTMWAAYVFVVLALISFPQALEALLRGDTLTGITWLSQSFLQLVLLPVILVGQRVISMAQDARAETDHEILTELHFINQTQLKILRRMNGEHEENREGQTERQK